MWLVLCVAARARFDKITQHNPQILEKSAQHRSKIDLGADVLLYVVFVPVFGALGAVFGRLRCIPSWIPFLDRFLIEFCSQLGPPEPNLALAG